MNRRLFNVLVGVSLLLLPVANSGCRPKASTGAPVIREVTASGHRFGIAEVFLSKSTLRLFWKRTDGSRIGTFDKLNAFVSESGDRLVFATNAGIFDPTFSPCGAYVQDGQELVPLNLNSGAGNFYLKPNGVFVIDSRGAAIIESSTYRTLPATPRLATQSGPLLLNNGQVNPQFSTNSNSRRIRSGIGVISPDHVVFAISRDPVTFYEFASLFQNTLACHDALYLDGEVSKFYPDPINASDRQDDFAGIFAVTEHD